MKLPRLLLLLFLALPLGAMAQSGDPSNIPYDVYYLLPSFSTGTLIMRGQMPATGQMNICAANNSLRFIDREGRELEAAEEDSIVKVIFDSASFLHSEGVYYRLYPLQADMGVALRRDLRIIRNVKAAGYGGTSMTSAVQSYGTLYADGAVYSLDRDKQYPYEVSETIYIYKGDTVFAFNKRNLRKLFPARKADVDAWFKAGHPLPKDVEGGLSLLRQFAEQ